MQREEQEMDTRRTQRRGVQKDYGEAVDDLVRQPIREPRKRTTKGDNDQMTSSLDDGTTTKDTFSDRVANKQNFSESKRKVNVQKKSKKPATIHEHAREDVHNGINEHRDSDLGTEEENSDEELLHPATSNIHTSSSKDVPKSRPSDVREKEPLLDTMKNKAFPGPARERRPLPVTKRHEPYSDDEEDQPRTQPERGNHRIPIFTVLALVLVALMLVASFWMSFWEKPTTNTAEKKLQVLTAFQDRFRKLQMVFTGQSPDLWQRSQRILELQLLNGNENKDPAIILLTAGKDAEQMLHCVGDQLADIYASTLNSSYTRLSGLEMNSEDSEDVKMDIDQRLSEGFQTNKKAAVLHRIELLPPGSLIILYKYCDHENAAFKNIALVLTVLLADSTLQPDIQLKELEETVHDFLKDTFINEVQSGTSHNQMDGDKLGGLWSRISHVVLPVLPGKSPVKECGASHKPVHEDRNSIKQSNKRDR